MQNGQHLCSPSRLLVTGCCAGVACGHSAPLLGSTAVAVHVVDAVDSIVGTLGPVPPALENMLLQPEARIGPELVSFHLQFACPKARCAPQLAAAARAHRACISIHLELAWLAASGWPCKGGSRYWPRAAAALALLQHLIHHTRGMWEPAASVLASAACVLEPAAGSRDK